MTRVLFCGLGSIGLRHARLLRRHFGAELYAYRTRRGDAPEPDLKIAEIRSLSDIASVKPDAVFITNPTDQHARTVLEVLKAGVPRLFLEKPIECDLPRLRALRTAARRSTSVIYVAYPLRFHPVSQELRRRLQGRRVHHLRMVCSSWLPDWRPGRDYRRGYSADGRRGGGVLLDLSHEFDLAQFLTGRSTVGFEGWAGRSGLLEIRCEDQADVLMQLKGGVRANIHLDFCSRRSERHVHVDHSGGRADGDLVEGRVCWAEGARAGTRRVGVQADAMYRAQLSYFLSAGRRELRADFEEKAAMTESLLRFRKRVLSR